MVPLQPTPLFLEPRPAIGHPQHKATYTFSSDVQSSLSIASASCCRRASSVPTSCPEREGDRLIPGHGSPAGGPGLPRTQDSGSSARGTLLPRGLRQRARGLHPLRSCPESTHYLPGPFLERPRLSRRSDPSTRENRVLDTRHPALRAVAPPSRPINQKLRTYWWGRPSASEGRLLRLVQSVALRPTTPQPE